MINKELRLTGKIGNDGRLYINDQPALDFFGRKHKEHKVIIKVKAVGKELSGYMRAYYREFIIPEFRKAYMNLGEYLTLSETEEKITELTPMLQKEEWSDEKGRYLAHPKKFEDLDSYAAVHCLTHLKQMAAMDFGFDIDEEQFY